MQPDPSQSYLSNNSLLEELFEIEDMPMILLEVRQNKTAVYNFLSFQLFVDSKNLNK
jgi:hypothetical protein